jgi:hypothetical protein
MIDAATLAQDQGAPERAMSRSGQMERAARGLNVATRRSVTSWLLRPFA